MDKIAIVQKENTMGKVTAHVSMSLDGFIAGSNAVVENPLGDGGERLHYWAFRSAAWREQHGLDGGEVNRDGEIIADVKRNVGAVLMGRSMFSNGKGPWGDDPFDGFWGDEPPYEVPVFVLTHYEREPLVKGKTTFTFVTGGFEDAMAQAQAVAGDKNVDIAGGANVIQQAIAAGLLDEFVIHLAPVLFGEGIRLFDHLGSEHIELERIYVIDSPEVTHLRFRVVK